MVQRSMAAPGRVIIALLSTLGACAGAAPEPAAEVTVTVAPLRLAGVADATYTLTVRNGADAVVWTRGGITSQGFGDGAGSLSYVGTCDAASNPNEVEIRLDGLSDATGPLAAQDWVNPTPVARDFTCVADADVAVDFDLTVLRGASQGFFDVSVNFDDIFCSAKLDCVSDSGGPLTLLHDGTGARVPSVVVGFACTAGPGQSTTLYLDDVTVACDDGVSYLVDPSGGPGNLGGAAPGLAQAATYRGQEGFSAVEKCYWNTVLGVGVGFGDNCVLTATGSAASTAFDGLETPDGQRWPLIAWSVPLTDGDGAVSCTRYALDGGTEVATSYTDAGDPHPFAHAMTCADGALLSAGPPTVLGMAPLAGQAGDPLTITGSGFGSTPGTVKIGGEPAQVQTWTPSTIVVTIPAGGGTGVVEITDAQGTPTAETPYYERTDLAPATIPELNNGTSNWSIWDLDFDAAGNTYFAEYISGRDDINVVHGDGTTATLAGNSNWNMGFVAATPDGSTVVTTYSWSSAPAIGVVDASNFVEPAYLSSVTACSSFTVSGYSICGPTDPQWGHDGYFYVANALVSGGVSRFIAANLVAGSPPVAVTAAPLPSYIVSLAMLPNGALWAAAGTGIYTIDKHAGTWALLTTFGLPVRSIAASPFTGKLYAESGGTLYEVAANGTQTTRYTGLAGSGFLVVGPDQQLYRVQGAVDAMSTITSYAP
ncbi:MAG: hypothetical protein CVU56_28745 [Deltaproteobacteria bacterium HGW-Deltaproteobacteria-14]|jgi:hypothetical protein|nr:MAG: hypothetical protein CVU56_28745 [Deltaproteobacteria bacterium HGW-Deltaproteobacteria-14]